MSKRQLQNGAGRLRTRLFVVPRASGWLIEGLPAGGTKVYKTQREAVAAARKLIQPSLGGEVVIHGRDGKVRGVDTYTVGADSFDRISAVEGVVVSEEMKQDFVALDRMRLSPLERREWLIAKYGSRGDLIRRRK